MANAAIRIQLISDAESIDALSKAADAGAITTEPHKLPVSDQRVGVAEVAAIIAVVHTSVQIVELLVKTYKSMRGAPKRITVKTPKGSVTIEGDASITKEAIVKSLEEVGIV